MLLIVTGLFVCVIIAGLFFHISFNRILSNALVKSFNSTMVSDVYQLKFKNLNVNLFQGNIKVRDVEIYSREKPLKEYPYINSSFRLKTKKITLTKVKISTLLKKNILKLEKIEIAEPDVIFTNTGVNSVFLPFKDTVTVSPSENQEYKRSLDIFLKEFKLINAAFRVTNSARGRDLNIKNVNITLNDLMIDQLPGRDIISNSYFSLHIGEITGSLQNSTIKYIGLKDYKMTIDSLEIQKTTDTLIYHFNDFNLGLNEFDLHTADSIFHYTLQSFLLSYSDKSIIANNAAFEPNISKTEILKRFKYKQNSQFSGTIGSLYVSGINFDSLLFSKKLLIDKIEMDSVSASILADISKPLDTTRFPVYFGQRLQTIALPISIKQVSAANFVFVYNEQQADSSFSKVNISRGNLEVEDITNLSVKNTLWMKADAYIENKAHFNLALGFNYSKEQFSIDGSFDRFNLTDLNPVIEGFFGPVKIKKGIVDEIAFSGIAGKKEATGTMKFLYHDLGVEIELKEKANWKSSLLSFAANTVVVSANPAPKNLQPKVVKYQVVRDMNKSFLNITLKSIIAGIKETIVMSKENRKAYNQTKKQAKEKLKNENQVP